MPDVKIITLGTFPLYSFVDGDKRERVHVVGVLPKQMAEQWEGQAVYCLDWRISEDGNTVHVEYQTKNDAYAPILDATLAVRTEKTPLRPPTRSKNWKWSELFNYWLNTKTGEHVYP